MTHQSTFWTIARADRTKPRKGSAGSPTLSAAIPIAAAMTMSCRTLNDSEPSGEPSRPRMLPGTRPPRKSHQEPVESGAVWAAASTLLLRPGCVTRPRVMPIVTAISAVIPNHRRVCPARRAALVTFLRLAMLTITAVTISGGTSARSSVTNVLPMVSRVAVSQLGSSGPTGPISRATSPRTTPRTRATRTCAANGTRRRRASTMDVPFGRRVGCRTDSRRGQQPAVVTRP
jgi:hypothetical protein